MEWSDTALVLRVGRFRETDLWLRLLTSRRGLLSAFAFGGSRSRRRFAGCLDLLNVIQVRARDARGGQYLNLEEGALLEGPRRLRGDWRRLGMLMNCVRFLEAQGVAPDNAQAAFSLTRSMLRLGEEAEALRDALPVLFRLRLATDQGYAPDFSRCGLCGSDTASGDSAWFRMESGLMACAACRDSLNRGAGNGGRAGLGGQSGFGQFGSGQSGSGDWAGPEHATPVPGPVVRALVSVQRGEPGEWNALELAPHEWRAFARLADGFVQFHLGLVWDRGRFRRN